MESEIYDESTLGKVYGALLAAGLNNTAATDAVNQMQNAGILFRERATTVDHRPTYASAILRPPSQGATGRSAHVLLADRLGRAGLNVRLALDLCREIEARAEVGMAKYGQPLRPGNGRPAWVDAWQEALDLCAYLVQWLAERPDLGTRAALVQESMRLLVNLWNEQPTDLVMDGPAAFPQAPRADLPGDAQ